MQLLVLGHDEVTQLLPMTECIEVMRDALRSLAAGDARQPLRSTMMVPGLPGFLGLMPGYVGGPQPCLGIKFLGIFPGNPAVGKDPHQGVVMVLDAATGEPKAVLDASAITAIRTAAVSAVATDLLAREEAATLAVIGTGGQAVAHVRAIAQVRALTEVRLVGRDSVRGQNAQAGLAAQLRVPVRFGTDCQAALDGADIVVTATNSPVPVLRHDWLSPGAHVNAVGACLPSLRELDTATVVAARLFTDRRESALNESGDFLIAAAESGIDADHIVAELGEVLAGTAAGRTSAGQLTVFESLGLTVEDLAAAAQVCAQAERLGVGTRVAF
ncbi:ornithine cyclodeaminase [Rhizocola hellebori]|uniref:Ornithine cyclodeaminase n=1 Tax=Rhizocola hellebori TaxID=1392758 RepID=A0A8J3Q4E3_9ACTN|nr:ornithine cyclodeaminase family protein [Rhizocola hellebori]GIH03738.1 ornithine cyclodeaminase [Rhizocola hellebori]